MCFAPHGQRPFEWAAGADADRHALLRQAEQRYHRPADLGKLEISITPPGYEIDRATVQRYATAGVDRLVLRPQPALDAAGLEQFAATTAQTLGI